MKATEKLIRARIQIQRRNPFFAYLSLYLKFRELNLKEGEEDPLQGNGAGVDVNGNLVYKPEWIDTLSDEECIGLILHEIMHLSFMHLFRRGTRNPENWNIAADISVNKIILDNKFELPKQGILPEYNSVDIFGTTIENLNEKSTEMIYDELPEIKEKQGFDMHMEGKNGDEDKLQKEWMNKVQEAAMHAKMKGELPAGIERLIEKLHESKINWKSILQRYILETIPYDYTYARPNKKSIASGFYMPDYSKEKINIAVAIDTSGSINQNILTDFLSEIIGIAKTYRNRIDMTLFCHDTDVKSQLKITNGNIDKIKQIKIVGGGGTSHKDVFEKIKKGVPQFKAAVFLTDGYSDLGSMDFNEPFSKIFLISKGGDDSSLEGKRCKIVKL